MNDRYKEVDYISKAQQSVKRNTDIYLTKDNVKWILKRFAYYVGLLLVHGYSFRYIRLFMLKPYYVISDQFKAIENEHKYAASSTIHGVFVSAESSGNIQQGFELEFKPTIYMRRVMEEALADPDLTYNLIT